MLPSKVERDLPNIEDFEGLRAVPIEAPLFGDVGLPVRLLQAEPVSAKREPGVDGDLFRLLVLALGGDRHPEGQCLLALLHVATPFPPGVEGGDGREIPAALEELERCENLIADAVAMERPVCRGDDAGPVDRFVQKVRKAELVYGR